MTNLELHRSVPYRCSLRTGTVLDGNTIFYHGSRKPRVEYKFEVDPNGNGKLLSGRRESDWKFKSGSVGSSERPQIKQEEPIGLTIKPEFPPQSPPSWLNPSLFYNTEPHSCHLPPAYTPTSSRLLMPYDPNAESSTFDECSRVMDEDEWRRYIIKEEDGKENEDQHMSDTNDRRRVKLKRENSFKFGTQTAGEFFRNMEREFGTVKNLLGRGEKKRKRRRNGGGGGGSGGDDVDMK
ncbi:hypothetical protein ACMFMG_009237 [Clarireedia jacksonii]